MKHNACSLTPREIVAELDKYIVGQRSAKRAVAVALRNRYRRSLLTDDMREEVAPKNILMIGPTGVGKTEIARRLAKLVGAPFVKVEATKFTEVGYVGRDVDSIVRELVEASIRIVRAEKMVEVSDQAEVLARERVLDVLHPGKRSQRRPSSHALGALFGVTHPPEPSPTSPSTPSADGEDDDERRRLAQQLRLGMLDDRIIEIEVEESQPQLFEVFSGTGVEGMGFNLQDLFGNMLPRKMKKRKVTVKEALRIFQHEESQKLIDGDEVAGEAIQRAEQSGIVFLDEFDKIAGGHGAHGPDVSREGVQRDILPIVEGSTVTTKYGPVRTDHMLFIAAGAFHVAKPSDLIPELQGRFPIRVELESLTREDFVQIMTEPKNALLKQYAALLATEGVTVQFLPDGVDEIAKMAQQVNDQTENIGARRLHTMLERLLEEELFNAPDLQGQTIQIDRTFVQERLANISSRQDLSHYIL